MEQYTTIELKAMAYEQISIIEKAKITLQALNQEIAKREIKNEQVSEDR